MSEGGSKRCFVAIEPDDAARADLAEAVAGLTMPGLRLTATENLHVTVKFLGDVLDRDLDVVIEALGEAVRAGVDADGSNIDPFELNSDRLIVLPDQRRPRVLAAAFDRPPQLATLVERVEASMEACGFPREGRAYTPHVTLGRFKFRGRPPRDFAPPPIDLPATGFGVDRLVLMSSDLRRSGPVYAALAELPFA